MQFTVNETSCGQMCQDMQNNMRRIVTLVQEIDSSNNQLRAALGNEDYASIARTTRAMSAALTSAQSELNTIITDMTDYLSRVKIAHITLQG